ncbi:MAG: HAMP domain-containing histidine kinase, partial [Deltaproteobacteria bacterium]
QSTEYSTEEFNILSTEFNRMVGKVDRMVQGRDYLLRAVNHELRGPMSRLKIQAEMIDDEKIRQSINEDLVELEEMMENLLEVERVQSGADTKKHPFNLSELSEQIHSSFEKQGKSFKLSLESDEVFLNADPVRIKILIKNLIENGFKYADGKGLELKIASTDKEVLITVSDEGPGVSSADQKHIFDAFYRADKVRSSKKDGLGLGLHLCQEIVHHHKGQILLNSSPNAGSRFEITLPSV